MKKVIMKLNEVINSPYIVPRKEVVIGVAAQDVQISGSITGGHVAVYPLTLLTDEGSPKSLFGALISGVSFFDV